MDKQENPDHILYKTGFKDKTYGRWYSSRHAAIYGIGPARLLAQVYFLTEIKIRMGEDPDENGFVWFYHTDEDFQKDFPDMNSRSLRRHIQFFNKLNILQLKYNKTNKNNKVRYIALDYDALLIDFEQRWDGFRKNATFKVHDETGESMTYKKDSLAIYIPYDLNFEKDKIFCEAKMSLQDSKNIVLSGQNDLTLYNIHTVVEYIYIHIMTIFIQIRLKNTQHTKKDELPLIGKISFEELWDFYHTLFEKSKKGKQSVAKIYFSLKNEQRNVCFTKICHYFLCWCFEQNIALHFVKFDINKQNEIKKQKSY